MDLVHIVLGNSLNLNQILVGQSFIFKIIRKGIINYRITVVDKQFLQIFLFQANFLFAPTETIDIFRPVLLVESRLSLVLCDPLSRINYPVINVLENVSF